MSESTPAPMPAGWYDDPFTDHLERYWTGESWTKETRARTSTEIASTPVGPAAFATTETENQAVVVRDYLVPSILTLIFCFWPLAIPAVYFAARANSAKGRGDIPVALHYSERALLFIKLAIGAGVLVVIYLIFVVVFQGVEGLGLSAEVPY